MKDGKYVLLYVDDDPDFRDSMRTVLEANDYYFVEAETGEEGMRKFHSESPDVIILDLMMEEVDTGTSMVRDLKLAGCTAPIFVISSVGEQLRESMDFTELGVAGVLQKPVDFDDLLTLIKIRLR